MVHRRHLVGDVDHVRVAGASGRLDAESQPRARRVGGQVVLHALCGGFGEGDGHDGLRGGISAIMPEKWVWIEGFASPIVAPGARCPQPSRPGGSPACLRP